MVIYGALYRVTGSGDPQEGRESQRICVPQELRKALMRNYHSTVWAKHQHSRSMHKQMVAWYYWNTMEKDIQEYVSTCGLCQLAKGTKPSRQGFLGGWKHSKVLLTVRMDLVGPIGAEVSGGKAGAKPRHILVIADPYSRMVWLEIIITKSAEGVYDKFVNRFLLEEGCPKVILTDNGREFSNKLLRELMRLCRIRLKYTPPYHLRGNYTDRYRGFGFQERRAPRGVALPTSQLGANCAQPIGAIFFCYPWIPGSFAYDPNVVALDPIDHQGLLNGAFFV